MAEKKKKKKKEDEKGKIAQGSESSG